MNIANILRQEWGSWDKKYLPKTKKQNLQLPILTYAQFQAQRQPILLRTYRDRIVITPRGEQSLHNHTHL